MTTLDQSSPKSPEFVQKATKAGLARWKLETLTGLLGVRSLQHHQREAEKNQAAENRAARIRVWGSTDDREDADDMGGHTVLGDVTHPTPVIIAGQQSSGIGKMLAGAAIAAGLIGIPGAGIAGFLLNQYLQKQPAPVVTPKPTEDNTLDLGLLRWEDLKDAKE